MRTLLDPIELVTPPETVERNTYFVDEDGDLNYAGLNGTEPYRFDAGTLISFVYGANRSMTDFENLQSNSSYLFEAEGKLFTNDATEITDITIFSVWYVHRHGDEEEQRRQFHAAFTRRKLNLLFDHD